MKFRELLNQWHLLVSYYPCYLHLKFKRQEHFCLSSIFILSMLISFRFLQFVDRHYVYIYLNLLSTAGLEYQIWKWIHIIQQYRCFENTLWFPVIGHHVPSSRKTDVIGAWCQGHQQFSGQHHFWRMSIFLRSWQCIYI